MASAPATRAMTSGATDRLPDPLLDTLVRGGSLTPEAARAALDRQVMHGGALDTALLEVGVPEAAIRAAMTEVYEQPMATREELTGTTDPRALRAIPEQWALRHRLPPIRLADGGRALVVLSPGPADVELLGRLSELLDLTVVAHLALEVRVVQALSRLYGTKPPDRFLPLLVAPPDADAEAASSMEPLSFAEASARLRDPGNRHDIARALLGFALRELAFGALWVVKDQQLEGWMGFGAGTERLGDTHVSVATSSAVHTVLESQAHYLGPSPQDTTQEQLLEALGRQAPRAVLMVPLRVKSRVVAVLYGENGPDPIPGRLAGDIMLLVSQVQNAFEQLLLRQKAETLSQLSRAPEPAPPLDDSRADSGDVLTQPEGEVEPGFETDPALPDEDEEQPTLPESAIPVVRARPRPESTASLPDEPMPTIARLEDEWDPVEVDAGDYVEGYEMVKPRVLTAEDRIDPEAARERVPTAPGHSGEPSPTTSDVGRQMGSDGLSLVASELAPRAITNDSDESDDLWASREPAPEPTSEDVVPPFAVSSDDADEDEEPTHRSVADHPDWSAPTPPSVETGPQTSPEAGPPAAAEPPSDSISLEIEAPTDASRSPDAAEPPPAGLEDTPTTGFDAREFGPHDPPVLDATSHIEEALWAEAGQGLVESLLDDEATTASANEGEPWDATESNAWSVPNMEPVARPEAPPPKRSSQPVLLINRAPADASTGDEPVPSVDAERVEDAITRLKDSDAADRDRAALDLVAIGPGVLPALMELFPGPTLVDPFQRRSVPPFDACGPLLGVLARFGAAAHPYVSRHLEAPEPTERFYAAYFYSAVHIPDVIPRLVRRLHDEEPRICMMAARTLFGYRGHPDFNSVIEHLHGRLGATSLAARRHAAYLIGLFRDVSALPLLIEVLERRERGLVDVTQDALTEITKQQLGPSARKWRAWLDRNRDRSRIEWLIDGLSAKDAAVRRSAAEELRAVTGQDFGFEPEGSRREREHARQAWLEWWADRPR